MLLAPSSKTNWAYLALIIVLGAIAGWTIIYLTSNTGFDSPKIYNISAQAGLGQEEEEEEEPQTRNKEVIDGLVIIKELDKQLIKQKIDQGREFLYRMEDRDEHGFHKYYYALTDSFEDRIHVVYSASIIYTFLYIYDLEEDEQILRQAQIWADFLLSMQNQDADDSNFGAFHYSLYLKPKQKEQKFVIGTAGLSIFTLLRLYDLLGDEKYLESAKRAGDWLIAMQKDNGFIMAQTRLVNGQWEYQAKESLLYNGQALSSLAKLYQTTQDEKYYNAGQKIADNFAEMYEQEQGYIEGQYRTKNPISNAWVVMSLMDLYLAKPNKRYLNVIFPLSKQILANQKNNPNDPIYYGSWGGAYSSSGLGWISEVMAETYRFCRGVTSDVTPRDCGAYKQAVVKAIRNIIQSTYSAENINSLPNPEQALGGVFWNKSNKYVRTDSVCHALNSYIRIFDYLNNGILLSL